MVSIGTVLTLGIVGAVVAGGYALYRNADKIGGALSRGVETNLTNPLGNYFDSLWKNAPTGAAAPQANTPGPTGPTQGINPATITNPLPTATAQTPTGDTGITPKYANELEKKYLDSAIKKATTALAYVNPVSRDKILTTAEKIAASSPTPNLTTAQSVVDQIRTSVGGKDPNTNKFYQLYKLNNTPYTEKNPVLPLSKEAVSYYAKKGIIAREVYL